MPSDVMSPTEPVAPAAFVRRDIERLILEQIRELLRQLDIMKRFALARGIRLPPEAIAQIAECESAARAYFEAGEPDRPPLHSRTLQSVMLAHGALSEAVRPATPSSIQFSYDEEESGRKPRRGFLAATYALTALSLAAVIASWTLDNTAVTALSGGALGASFFNLYWIHTHLRQGTFDSSYATSYFVRWVLGLLSGFVLATVLKDWVTSDKTAPIGPLLLATIGGFAADAVNDILLRITDTIRTLVQGRADQAVRVQKELLEVEGRRIQTAAKLDSARDLGDLLARSKAAGAPPEVLNAIQALINTAVGAAPPPPPPPAPKP